MSLLAGTFAMAWRAHRSALAGRLLVTAAGGLAPVAAALLLRLVLDDLARGHARIGALLPLVIAMGVVGGLAAVLFSVGNYLTAQAGRAIQRRAIAELFTAVTRLTGLRRLEDPDFQQRLQVAQQAGSSGPGQAFSAGLACAESALTLGGFLITLIVLSPVLAGVVLLAAIPAVFAELGMARERVALMNGISHGERRQHFYASLLSDRAAAKEIRLFGLGWFFRARMLAELRGVQRANERVDRRQLAVYAGLAALSALVAAGGTWWAVRAATRGQLTIGDLTLLIAALAAVASTLTSIITSAAVTYQSLLMFASFREVVTQEPDLPLPPHPVQAGPLRRGIELRDVWFRYGPDQPWILRGVSLLIPRGQALALVGHNGAGKSTLVKLLCRFYDPDRGAILWDGTDLRELDLGQLRDRVSVVFQDYMSYELSAADNIAVGDLAQQRPALVAAARRAGIHQVLETLPKGYDTLLTRSYYDLSDADDPQAGVLLSGGQWQRLALARAFLRADRDLAVLDEPSAGLDAEAEHQLQGSLRADRRGRTTLLISHRLNTVRDADQIVVLSDGVVAEQGGHDVLMARGGIYARLFSLQAQGYTGGSAAVVAPSAILSGSGHD